MLNREAEDGRRVSTLDLLTKYALPAIPVVGLLVYGLLRQLYAIFYGTLGASPEEVGLGYSEILALSAVGVVFIVAIAIVAPLIVLMVARLPLPWSDARRDRRR